MPRVLVPLADGFEEIEATTIIDILRRADVDVVTASLKPGAVRAAHGLVYMTDATLDEVAGQEFDLIALPGGLPGADNLDNDERIHGMIKKQANAGKPVAAICAAPKVLANAGLLDGKKATSYPGFVDKMDLPNTTYTGAPLEKDGKITTSRGPGTAMDFALSLVEDLQGAAKRKEVEDALVRS
jgi:4-methyl-5(b-hydroxyethyl)-thiazole monophosphate biosynthesis